MNRANPDFFDADRSEPKIINTSRGERYLTKGTPTPEFWAKWKTEKNNLKEAGYSVSRDAYSTWELCHWGEVPQDVKNAVATALAASKAESASSDFSCPCPDGLAYLPYQLAGIEFAASRQNTLIADEMGLGKTIQALGVVNYCRHRSVLIVCPASLKLNWARECAKWLVDSKLTIGIAEGNKLPSTDIVIINYDILGRHIDALRSRKFELIVRDEAHYLKNPKAARTITGWSIWGTQELYLTGTPMPNKVIDGQLLAERLDAEKFHFWRFARRYCDAYEGKYGWDFSGAKNLEELNQELRLSGMLARRKKDVLSELPDKQYQVLEIKRSRDDKQLDALLSEHSIAPDASGLINLQGLHVDILGAIAKMRQQTALRKVSAVAEQARAAVESQGKVVIFAHHKSVVQALYDDLSQRYSVVTLTGDSSQGQRQQAVDDLQSGHAQIFIGSITAAGVGITLTAASTCIFAELDWMPGNMQQAEDRLHRVGQKNSVLVQFVVAEGSIDAMLAKSVTRKAQIIERAVG